MGSELSRTEGKENSSLILVPCPFMLCKMSHLQANYCVSVLLHAILCHLLRSLSVSVPALLLLPPHPPWPPVSA